MVFAISSGPCAAYWLHRSAIFSPTKGSFAIKSGGGASVSIDIEFAQPAILSALLTIVKIAADNGTTNIRSSATVMTVTASARLPHSRRCTASMIGHVDTTIIVDHISAERKGRTIHNDADIRMPIKSTAKTVRAKSWRKSVCMITVEIYVR